MHAQFHPPTSPAQRSTDPAIVCGRCGKSSPIEEWQRTAILGPLPPHEFQCPACRYAFKRMPETLIVHGRAGWRWVITEIQARL